MRSNRGRCAISASAAAPRSAHSVAYAGVPGAFSEEATLHFLTGRETSELRNATVIGCADFESVVNGVVSGQHTYGVLPIEDSVTGTFHQVYEILLATKGAATIVGEQVSETAHCLCVKPSVPLSEVRQVASHPAILAQCSGYLGRLQSRLEAEGLALDGVTQLPFGNSATAASALATAAAAGAADAAQQAVICSRRAAELYGLEVLDAAITDDSVATRYIAIGAAGSEPPLQIGARVKSSIVLALPNEPLALFKTLAATALRDINIAKIESRPAATLAAATERFSRAGSFEHWEYVFYLDLEVAARHGGPASTATVQLDAALDNIREFAIQVTELGRYSQNKEQIKANSTRDLYR
eukprot:SAG11_NODE_262_length_11529_cov_12.277603_8_plen_356_part_00